MKAIAAELLPIVTRNAIRGELEMPKRTYVPFTITAKCPTCGVTMTRDLDDDYLSYPILGKPIEVSIGHEATEATEAHELTVRVILDLTLKVAS